jgi:(1->4)-alpha-D-glucan 1-alpha-D-glucosylmutase
MARFMPHAPIATYRLQLHKGFTFAQAAAMADYLKQLGVSHAYCSPYLQAAPGSTHGYDVVDHQRVNEELGGAAAHHAFCQQLGEVGLGQVLDIVPNHMSLGRENRYWWDVLENGESSRYASFFDIDWNPQEERLKDKVLVPILGDQYGRVVQAGGIVLKRAGDAYVVEAAGQEFPVAPHTLPAFLYRAAEFASQGNSADTLRFIAASFGRLPSPDHSDRTAILGRHRDKLVIYRLLQTLCADDHAICVAVDHSIEELNANRDALDDFLSQQNYRLAYWKVADQQLGYRRFFDVNTLIGLRTEREFVFEETHALILDWLHTGVIDGVRVDHPDGLRDPLEYFRRLRQHAPDAWIVGEKILEPGEYMRKSWPIEGTSGYDFLNAVMSVLIDAAGLAELTEIYARFTEEPTHYPSIAYEKKKVVTREALASDVNRLANIFIQICEQNRNYRDVTRDDVKRAIREVASCFSVYRTYVVPVRDELADEDRSIIARAVHCAKDGRPDLDAGMLDFLQSVLTNESRGRLESEFLLRFQQFTSPVMAKGVEDTAFYCFNRLVALCEVGGDPDCMGRSIENFHEYNRHMQATYPLTMTALSTHDTKRADDVRARLLVLTERPQEFATALDRWSSHNEPYRENMLPDRNTEYLYYQTLIGSWPCESDWDGSPTSASYQERIKNYMQKATREAKQHTSWVANDEAFESALQGFIDATLTDQTFIADMRGFVDSIKQKGRINSLAQTLMKSTAPGIPDLYQGGELWDLSLVDPDNRRPVDYDHRRKLLAELKNLTTAEILERWDDALPKLHVIHESLLLRAAESECFAADASYEPLTPVGAYADRAIAYMRKAAASPSETSGADAPAVVVVVPRLGVASGDGWGDTHIDLPHGQWRHVLAGATIPGGSVHLSELFAHYPVALLAREKGTR